ncbi:dynein regulatory complex protein 1-like isoform X2 [Liolophura sinensis]|uniref:dynein regulatory complex protein 1-like isoform X2 n=1 Tax=Liolophura sinensis TaxID=3198878 RepID=UPI00315857BC
MSSSGEEEEVGPSVDSNDPEERIAARRIRIARRIEAQRRAAMGVNPDDQKEVKEETSKSGKQMEDSRLRLTKLRDDGMELVTNIRVAGDAREQIRRGEEEESKRQRKEKLEQEAKTGSERFEEITKKWESALQKDIPQHLHEMLRQQKSSCDAMIDEKNKLISDFQTELKAKDDQYVKDLKKQAEDVDLMIERMEEQIKNLSKAYREELNQCEKAFVTERSELLEMHRKKWEERMVLRREKEVEFLKTREKRVEEYENQLQLLRIQDSEEYNMVKIRLETDVQILEQQLQQMRATYQLNQEKLEYNFQVLKKRDDENTITKSQQKRKITRLQDVLNGLKIRLAKQEKQYRDENQSLTEDYKRIRKQFEELQKKSKHFMAADAKKFHDIWCMNEEELKELGHGVIEADRVIHEQQLGLNYQTPDIKFMENEGPLNRDASLEKGVSASQVLQEVLSQSGTGGSQVGVTGDRGDAESEGYPESEGMEQQKSTIMSKISASTIKMILELLCDESGFLVETKLKTLLAPLEQDERSLMKVDAIFSALGVDTEEDVHKLSTYFMKVRQREDEEKKDEGDEKTLAQSPDATEVEDADAEILRLTGREGEAKTESTVGGSPEDISLIHPNEVIKALRMFVEDNRKPIREKGHKSQFKITALEARDSSGDSQYWASYAQLLNKRKEQVWNALLEAFEKYSEILSSRSTLITETDALRQQNAELRMLLHQYVNSKVCILCVLQPSLSTPG